MVEEMIRRQIGRLYGEVRRRRAVTTAIGPVTGRAMLGKQRGASRDRSRREPGLNQQLGIERRLPGRRYAGEELGNGGGGVSAW